MVGTYIHTYKRIHNALDLNARREHTYELNNITVSAFQEKIFKNSQHAKKHFLVCFFFMRCVQNKSQNNDRISCRNIWKKNVFLFVQWYRIHSFTDSFTSSTRETLVGILVNRLRGIGISKVNSRIFYGNHFFPWGFDRYEILNKTLLS